MKVYKHYVMILNDGAYDVKKTFELNPDSDISRINYLVKIKMK